MGLIINFQLSITCINDQRRITEAIRETTSFASDHPAAQTGVRSGRRAGEPEQSPGARERTAASPLNTKNSVYNWLYSPHINTSTRVASSHRTEERPTKHTLHAETGSLEVVGERECEQLSQRAAALDADGREIVGRKQVECDQFGRGLHVQQRRSTARPEHRAYRLAAHVRPAYQRLVCKWKQHHYRFSRTV